MLNEDATTQQETAPEQDNPPEAGSGPQPKEKRDLSTIQFPYLDLEASISLARTILDFGNTPMAKDQLAAHMKQKPASGNFNQKITAAKMFGLIETVQNRYKLTQLGFNILDKDEARQRAAREEAFLRVQLYKRVYEEFRGKQLPSRPHGLEQAFVGFGVAPKQRDKARQAFDRSARQAGFFAAGEDRLVAPVGPRGGASDETAVSTEAPKVAKPTGAPAAEHPFVQGLLRTLPEPETQWSLTDQAKWLEAAARIFALIYESDGGELHVTWSDPRDRDRQV